eukprot:TRINITY_DN13622_c0_g1_i2.p1 TRINITY_DN13622_c0_g1~~TRINITY_DN13622_c0_g1_i2.p1  ORF type:complete len:217 (+),score=77.31 TRINITY_DN13622_c0_g1_i2:129-779(+)
MCIRDRYNCHYTQSFLQSKAPQASAILAPIVSQLSSASVQGFCVLVHQYLQDACNPNRGDGRGTGGPERTILWGLQRPPLNGQRTVLRCDAGSVFDELAPTLVPFYVTNALESVLVSCDPANSALAAQLQAVPGLSVQLQTEQEFSAQDQADFYNVVTPDALADNNNTSTLTEFPMVAQFVSLYFPLGHVKSTRREDEAFVQLFESSDKWLKIRQD